MTRAQENLLLGIATMLASEPLSEAAKAEARSLLIKAIGDIHRERGLA